MFETVAQYKAEAPAGALGRPLRSNFPTWDALAVDDSLITLYQITVSDPGKHGMKASGLAALECLLPPAGEVRFVFVVPAERFDSAVRVVKLPGDAPAWASARLKQYVMTLSDEMLDAATRHACGEAVLASEAVDKFAAGTDEEPSRKRRAGYLPVGG